MGNAESCPFLHNDRKNSKDRLDYIKKTWKVRASIVNKKMMVEVLISTVEMCMDANGSEGKGGTAN